MIFVYFKRRINLVVKTKLEQVNNLFISVGWLWSSEGQVCPYQDLQQRGGDPVVQAARRPAWLHRVLHPHWYVGGWLHFLRDGLWQTSLPRLHGGGWASSYLQGDQPGLQWAAHSYRVIAGVGLPHRGQLAGYSEVGGARQLQVPPLHGRVPGGEGPQAGQWRHRPPLLIPPLPSQEEAAGQRGSQTQLLRVFPARDQNAKRQ